MSKANRRARLGCGPMGFQSVQYGVADGVATIALDRPSRATRSPTRCSTTCSARSPRARRRRRALRRARPPRTRRCSRRAATSVSSRPTLPLIHKYFGDDRFLRAVQADRRARQAEPVRRQRARARRVRSGSRSRATWSSPATRRRSARRRSTSGVFPFMIMALIYRNIGRKKTNELLLLGEQIDAREAERIGLVNRVVRGGRVRRRGRRLGGPARSQDAAADAHGQGRDVPRAGHGRWPTRSSTCTRSSRSRSHRGHPGGRPRVLREAGARVDRALSVAVLRCRTSDRTARRRTRRRGARRRAGPRRAADRHARRAARARTGTRTCATRAAASSRPAARSRTCSRPAASRS